MRAKLFAALASTLASIFAIAALPGCFFAEQAPARPIVIEAYPLPERHGEFVIGTTTQDEVMAAIGAPSSVEAVAGDRELWLYYPRTTETVYVITFKGRKGVSSFKYAPSNGHTLTLAFRRGKLVGI
jgi:outer membrane protein assembly factor BamE (lipoprotein component of BamABCDE complex)